jgi:hypothetical protein
MVNRILCGPVGQLITSPSFDLIGMDEGEFAHGLTRLNVIIISDVCLILLQIFEIIFRRLSVMHTPGISRCDAVSADTVSVVTASIAGTAILLSLALLAS